MQKVAVIGAGTMGNGIAHVFAQNDFEVNLVDISDEALDRGLNTISKNLDRQVSKGIIDEAKKEATLTNLSGSTDMATALSDADLVVEAATENVDLKLKIFGDMDRYSKPEAILASNTSSISLTQIAAVTSRPDKVIGMHFMNPVPVMKLVEVIRGIATSDETFAKVKSLAETMGKVTTMSRDYAGFLANRILMPMINEAFYTLMEGVGSAEDIDTTMKLGMNHPMGPLTLADFIGLDTCLYIMEVLHEGLGDSKYRPCPLLRQHVDAGWLGRKTKRGVFDYSDA